jgi:hypothetical protein
MTRILLLATVLAVRLCAGTISLSSACPGFTYGHMTISNCQTNTTFSISEVGFPGSLSLSPQVPFPGPNDLTMSAGTGGGLESNPDEAQFVEETLTADFTMDPEWGMSSVFMSFPNAGDDGPSVNVGGTLNVTNTQCQGIPMDGSGAFGDFCVPSFPLQSGTISLMVDIRSDKVCPTCFTDTGRINSGTVTLTQVFVPDQVPEPNTVVLIGLGIAAVCLFSRRSTRAV